VFARRCRVIVSEDFRVMAFLCMNSRLRLGARSSLFWDVTWPRLVVSHRRFQTCVSSSSMKQFTATAMQMGQLGCPETSVINYQSTLCNFPKERFYLRFISLCLLLTSGRSTSFYSSERRIGVYHPVSFCLDTHKLLFFY
jgi:hypothetical protein